MSRHTQPHRKGSDLRQPGGALAAMLAGRDANGRNPADIGRAMHRKRGKGKSKRMSILVQAMMRAKRG